MDVKKLPSRVPTTWCSCPSDRGSSVGRPVSRAKHNRGNWVRGSHGAAACCNKRKRVARHSERTGRKHTSARMMRLTSSIAHKIVSTMRTHRFVLALVWLGEIQPGKTSIDTLTVRSGPFPKIPSKAVFPNVSPPDSLFFEHELPFIDLVLCGAGVLGAPVREAGSASYKKWRSEMISSGLKARPS